MAGLELRRELSLYNGVSNRSRGWKSKKFRDQTEGPATHLPNLKRWDGAARTSYPWDSLRKDPELWYRNGNCFVHLYGKGQSRRGPAFKVPFSTLLAMNCYPLIARFMSRDVPESPQPDDQTSDGTDYWGKTHLQDRVELYIPPPPGSGKEQALAYHLATRNFFAWVFRRSIVGEHLGNALVGLMNSMYEFRSPVIDNVGDLMDYLDEEGYLDLRGQPNHALAILHLTETFQLRDPYINAFAHCAGMSDRLYLSSEYQRISSVSRRLIRGGRAAMDIKLGRAGAMLRTFLEDELSEAHLGLSGAARTHLDRFRTFLLSFYTTKLGYYPPLPSDHRSTIFETKVYRTMRTDFEALYKYLVDVSFTSMENSPPSAQGGICTLQSVESFDKRNMFKSLAHPLPLLPEVPMSPASKRRSWLPISGRNDKLRPDNRLVAHSALIRATNQANADLLLNDLVRAYRQFEETLIFSTLKADRMEKISQVDGRKVRWILIYSVYQTLRNCTETSPEVLEANNVPYCLSVPTDGLPPWAEQHEIASLVRRQTDMAVRTPSLSYSDSTLTTVSTPTSVEIKPDIDYFAITRRQSILSDAACMRSILSGPPDIPPRSQSLTGDLSRKGTFRRSLSLFRGGSPRELTPTDRSRRLSYHEIVIHGYGNGTNEVNMSADEHDIGKLLRSTDMTTRSPSTASNSSAGSVSHPDTSPSTPDSPHTAYTASPPSSIAGDDFDHQKRGRQPAKFNSLPPRRSLTTSMDKRSSVYSFDDMSLGPPIVPQRSAARNATTSLNGKYILPPFEPSPLRICKRPAVLAMQDGPETLNEIEDVLEDKPPLSPTDYAEDDIQPAWEQYSDLGGHTVPALASVNF